MGSRRERGGHLDEASGPRDGGATHRHPGRKPSRGGQHLRPRRTRPEPGSPHHLPARVHRRRLLRRRRRRCVGAGYRWERPPVGAVAEPTSWSISYVTSPRDAVLSVPWQGLRSLAFVATTQTSWVKNVASLVSLALGYGLTTTSDIAMAESGHAIDETSHAAREQAHNFLLHRLPARRAWAHYGVPSPSSSLFGTWRAGRSPHFVFLDETDELLADAPLEGSVHDLQEARSRARDEALLSPTHILTLPCELRRDRPGKWNQVFEQTLSTLRWLGAPSSGITFTEQRLRSAHEQARLREGSVAIPFLRWLETKDWRG
ncbi:hypothetical protein RS83_01861 [Microbacterium oxydans]|uniref:Uncharacterized protein n=1 Tax=Microbacterium oxydans TaxID=82380 RepID=A0A0F0L976_9MICO|nr:hypothetical protein RS83_01861 [Microbacterium oxydans]